MLTRFIAAAALAASLSACAPPVLKGTSDIKLRSILDTRSATAEAIAPLLSPNVEVLRADRTVKGVEAGAAALAELKPQGETLFHRHHDVSLWALGDGGSVLIQRDQNDKVIRAVELRAPGPSDGIPHRITFWGAAWNTDAHKPRKDLVTFAYAEDGRYVDPGHDVSGHEEINVMIGNFRMVVPGSKVKYAAGIAEMGNGWASANWFIVPRSGSRKLFVGVDVMHFDAEGKIDFLAGFINAGDRPIR